MKKADLSKLSPAQILEGLIARPWVVIGLLCAVTMLFAWQLPRLSFKTSVYDLIVEKMPATERYTAFKEIFGSDELIRVVVKGDNIFDTATFEKVAALAAEAAAIQGVRRVISLPGIKTAIDTSGQWSMEQFAAVMEGVKLFRRNLFSDDRRSTVLTVVLDQGADPEAVIASIDNLIASTPPDLSLYQIGMPLVSQALARLTQKDFFRLPPITFALIALVLVVVYRKSVCLLLPLACVALALVWTFGLMALTKIPISMLTMIVPVFLIAVGTAYCLHIMSEYLAQAPESATPREAARKTFTAVTFPTVLAVVTTAIGLASLLVNRIPTIREFALFACFGIFSFLTILLTFLPAVIALLPLPVPHAKTAAEADGRFERLLEWIARICLQRQKITLPLLGAVTVICVVGIFQLKVETNPVGYFKADLPVSRHFHDIYQDLSGSFPINVMMGGTGEDYFEDPQNVAAIARLQAFIETLPGVDKTISFADYLQLVNYASNRYEGAYYRLPEEGFEVRMLINSYRMMLGEDMLLRFMSPDFSKANILLLTHISSSQAFLETRDRILAFAGQNFSKDITWDVTGFGMVVSESSRQLTSGQLQSLALTMALIFGMMFLLFLSSKVGLIAIVPNVFPIVVNFGLMGWFGVELSMVTSLITSIAIGLAVDDTLHYLVRFNREFRKDLDDRRALKATIRHIGRPVITTTLTIGIGFSILAVSSFKPTAVFGVMMVVTMFSALVADLILLPSLIQHVELVTLWDLVRLKLGMEPGRGIPLFKGLSRTQVHYIVMAGSLQRFEAGRVLFNKGDRSETMFAVISGKLDVVEPLQESGRDQAHGLRKLITRLGSGAVVGEMGLLRGAPRSATVIASQDSELLQINWKMIQRLQWLYPPTAQKFLFNLMTMLCDRLEDLTHCLSDESIKDDLTGLYNRRGFTELLNVEVDRALRYEENLALGILEVQFASPGESGAYSALDQAYQRLGQTLAHGMRTCDTLGRLDERTFALLVSRGSTPTARDVAARLKTVLEKRLAVIAGLSLKLRFVAVSLQPGTDRNGADLMARAVQAFSQSAQADF